ncbi:MAG TPA: zinc-dependent alcohol dehydrogenase family protein [Gemmataceae bacterium]|nr:zinc-dependent alcohol dehydrogenase family protein [Gemmataceae bacterium]
MKAIVFDRFGEPAEVLQLRDVPRSEPGRGEVRVRMRASPINPSDLLVVRGQYGRLPTLPATPGFEGVGVIDAAGPGFLKVLRGLKPGRRVAVLNGRGGNWQEEVVLPARQVVPLPVDIPDEQAAAFFVNPATALVMTQWVLRVPRGAWLLQTAAGSALGRMVLRLGRLYGFRTINVVRRREQAEELLRLGGDAAIATNDESLEERVRGLTEGSGVPFALDAVGGTTAAAVTRVLAPGGRMLLYGTLSGEPIALEPRALMAGQKSIAGFWLSEWVRAQGVLTMLKLFRRIKGLLRAGVLTSEVGASFALDQIKDAVRQAETPGRHGKVLLRMAE